MFKPKTYIAVLSGIESDERAIACAKKSTLQGKPVTKFGGGAAICAGVTTLVFASVTAGSALAHPPGNWIAGLVFSIIAFVITIVLTAMYVASDKLQQYSQIREVDERLVAAIKVAYDACELGRLSTKTLWTVLQANSAEIDYFQTDMQEALGHPNPSPKFGKELADRIDDFAIKICEELSIERGLTEAGIRTALPQRELPELNG